MPPQLIEVPGQGTVEFPEEMSDNQIVHAIHQDSLRGQLATEQAKPNLAGAAAKVIQGVSDYVAEPLSQPAQTFFGGLNALGHVARGLAVDAYEQAFNPYASNDPILNTKAALKSFDPLPSEVHAGHPEMEPMSERILAGAAETTPQIAAMIAAPELGIPQHLAPALVMGGSTYAQTGDPTKATKAATLGLLLPAVNKFAGETAAGVLAKYAPNSSPALQKTVEAAAQQTAMNSLFVAGDAPEYLKAFKEDPDKAKDMLAQSIGVNLALGLPQILGIPQARVQSETQKLFGTVSRDLVDNFHDAMDQAREAFNPQNAQVKLAERPAPGGDKVGVGLEDFPKPGEVMPRELLELMRQPKPNALPLEPTPAPEPAAAAPAASAPAPIPAAAPTGSADPVQTSGPAAAPVPTTPADPRSITSGAWTKWAYRPDEVPDVLDAIHELGGVAGKGQSDFADRGEYDGYREAFSQGMAARLRRADGGNPPDELLEQLNTNYGYRFNTIDEMYAAVSQAAKERQNLSEQQERAEAELNHQEAQTLAFGEVALRNRGRSEAERVAADAVPVGVLSVGDTFALKGEKLTVTHYDPDTDFYTVEDGRKFGRQVLHADAQFFPDRGSLEQGSGDVEFDPTADAQTAAEHMVQAQRVRMAAGEPAVHALRAGPTPPLSTPAPATAPALPMPKRTTSPIRAWFQSLVRPLQNLVAPQTIDIHARTLANILRENSAKAAADLARADAAMKEYRRDFDRTPVPRGWKFDPAQPLPRNYDFLDQAERNRAALSPEHRELVKLFDDLFAQRIAEVRRLAPDAMSKLIAEYFPHIWKDPVAAQEFTAGHLGKAPFHGDKSFLRQRSVPYILDGLKRGLEPVSDNPVDLLLIKMHQMDKFILAERTLQEAQAVGLRKYLPAGKRVPPGWSVVNDRSSTVNGPPVVTVKEAYDASLRKGLMDFMGKMGFSHARVANLGITTWGQYTAGGKIESRFGGPDSVITHEIGHGLDERYPDMRPRLMGNVVLKNQLSALAKLRTGSARATKAFTTYIQTVPELMANAVHAYVHAPELMDKVAPRVKQAMEQFISAHPELADLNDIKPSLALMSSESEIPLPGFTVLGRYTMPDGAAQVLNNHLSPGLGRYLPYRTIRAGSNILNAAQLGLSAFHLGFTSLDAAVSSVAVGLQQLSSLDPKRMFEGAAKIGASPAAPISNYYLGKAVQEAMLHPGSTSFKVLGLRYGMSPARTALVNDVAQLAVTGGMRATVDPFYQTHFTRNVVRAFHQGGVRGYAGTVLGLPLMLVEQSMRPITEFLVPRQKLGVFAQMARNAMDALGPGATHDQVREALAKAADSTENRMGQMTYDNLFYNKIVKDVALLGFRAYGWQLGKYRESIGAVADTAAQAAGIFQGQRPELTNRMAYAAALPMVVGAIGGLTHYLMSGQRPQTSTDYFFPATGQNDKDGRPQRLMLPSYLKDLISDWRDFPDLKKMGTSFYHKLNPWVSTTVDLLRNRNFYGVEIRHEDDPFWKQQLDNVRYVLKSAQPFSVTGIQKLREEGEQRPGSYVLPFFGIVPAKKALTLTPAESKAAELMQDTLPMGTRTQAQFDHTQLVKTLAQDLRRDPPKGAAAMRAATQDGRLRPQEDQRIISMLTVTPLQYQVHKLSAENSMRVWDLANDQERAQLKDTLIAKVANSQTLDADMRQRYIADLTGTKPR